MQNKESPSLRECPFCGGEAVMAVGGDITFSVYCKNVHICGATQFIFDSEQEAIEAWNRRVVDGK